MFKYKSKIKWYQITRYRMIKQIYSLQCLQVAREMQESQLQNVSTCYKQIRKDMNTHEQTNDISSFLIIKSSFQRDESWEEDHQHQPHGSSRPLPHPWAFPQQSDTLIHRIVFVHHMENPCTYHGNSRNPMRYLVLHRILWHLVAEFGTLGHGIGMGRV